MKQTTKLHHPTHRLQTVRKYVERASKAKNHLYKGVIAVFVVLGGLLVASAGTGFGQVNDQKQYEDQVSDLKQKLTAANPYGKCTRQPNQFQKKKLFKNKPNSLKHNQLLPQMYQVGVALFMHLKNIDTQIWNEYRLFRITAGRQQLRDDCYVPQRKHFLYIGFC